MAPELLSDQKVGHSKTVDTWALGVIAFNLFSGDKSPFYFTDEDYGDDEVGDDEG